MANLCFKNPIIRDGTNQDQRLVKALLPEFVPVDERGFDELKDFVKAFADKIRFISSDPQAPTWRTVFDRIAREDQLTDPDFALFQTFLELFRIAQGDLNSLTKRHLDFYYEDVLRLKGKAPIPDKAFITFEAAKHIESAGSLISKGTRLRAGKDDLGGNLFYTTQKDLILNKGIVKEIKNLYRDPTTSNLYRSPVANSGDGMGGDFETDAMNWPPFGSNERAKAAVGFGIASPILQLGEGTRTVTLCLHLDPPANTGPRDIQQLEELDDSQWNAAFNAYFSGEKEWIKESSDALTNDPSDLLDTSEFGGIVERKLLDFTNRAKKWQDIAGVEPVLGNVFDSPKSGFGDQKKDYDIGRDVAEEMLRIRETLPNKKFETLSQIRAVQGVGEDKINDLVYSFGQQVLHATRFDPSNNTLCIVRTIGKDQEPIVKYNEEKLKDPFVTQWPVMKVVLANEVTGDDGVLDAVYPLLTQWSIKKVDIQVDVDGVRNLVVQNDQTVMDPSKTIHPFGIVPAVNSSFYIGSQEVFKKNLDQLYVSLNWHGLPATSFGEHYENYLIKDTELTQNNAGECVEVESTRNIPGLESRQNDSFTVDIGLLQGKEWIPQSGSTGAGPFQAQRLFDTPNGQVVQPGKVFDLPLDQVTFQRDEDLQPLESYDGATQQGFMRLTLVGTDFGHSDYSFVFTKQVLLNAQDLAGAKIPREPYTPQVKELSLNYVSSVSFDTVQSTEEQVEQYFHLTPFGVEEQKPKQNLFFLPQFSNEGECYIGIENLSPPTSITLLIQVLEGSEIPSVAADGEVWSYLTDEGWQDFQQADIISDSTNHLLTSGIVELSIPKNASKNNKTLTSNLHWLRVAVKNGARGIPDFVAIVAQAVTVEFQDNNNDPLYLATPLPKETIKKLEFSDSSIKKLKQPFGSFGGKIAEENTPFYQRISERLRHKQRAIAIWDYERVVLQEFSFLYKVKCLNHTKYARVGGFSELAPGHVTMIALSNVRNQNGVDPFRPETSRNKLESIKTYLQQYTTPAVTLHVRNPRYETVEVHCDVKFKPEISDFGFYSRRMEDAIKSFLSPWAYEEGEDVVFGGKIHRSTLIDFIDELPYVEFVTCLKLYQDASPDTEEDTRVLVDEAAATTSASILTSTGTLGTYNDHKISEASDDHCSDTSCDNRIQPPRILPADSCLRDDASGAEESPYDFRKPDTASCPTPEPEDDCEPEDEI